MYFGYTNGNVMYSRLVAESDERLDQLSRSAVSAELRRKAKIVLTHNVASLALALARAN